VGIPFFEHAHLPFSPSFSVMPTEKMGKKSFASALYQVTPRSPSALHYSYCIPAANAMSTPAASAAVIFALMLQAMISTKYRRISNLIWNNSFT
jgi:hypothetical protein